jgi:hypothetical protein
LKKEINFAAVYQICARHRIEIKDIKFNIGSFDKQIFFINHEYLLRVSETSMALEQEKFRRIAVLDFVPKIKHFGVLEGDAVPVHYTLLTLIPGDDFVYVFSETTIAQQKQWGKDVAIFLDHLYAPSGTHYDIGLYLPAIPNFFGT